MRRIAPDPRGPGLRLETPKRLQLHAQLTERSSHLAAYCLAGRQRVTGRFHVPIDAVLGQWAPGTLG